MLGVKVFFFSVSIVLRLRSQLSTPWQVMMSSCHMSKTQRESLNNYCCMRWGFAAEHWQVELIIRKSTNGISVAAFLHLAQISVTVQNMREPMEFKLTP